MKVIVVGNGGREHAIAWKLAQSAAVTEVVCVPGNGGTSQESKCRNVNPSDCDYAKGLTGNDVYVQIAKHEGCELAVVGPENPLAEGLADSFWNADIPTVGPKYNGAQLEASKDLAKAFMKKYGVACAKSETFTDKDSALAYIDKIGAPIVVKADGLAAGKGVVVAKTVEEAKDAVKSMMEDNSLGDAGSKLVIEEYLRGVEISVLAAVSTTPDFAKDGKSTIVPFVAARDHKRLLDGAQGPNTGGMGAISPVDDFTDDLKKQFMANILEPTLKGLVAENYDYRGFIFFGIMLTSEGPKCLEYNVRLGDPETQAVLPLMDFDFEQMCQAIVKGELKSFDMKWKPGYVASPVAVSGGYPKSYKKGMEIFCTKKLNETGAKVFIAGAVDSDKKSNDTSTSLLTNGGRVLACSGYGDTFDKAWNTAYEALKTISFEGMFYRKDIGLPGAAESN